MKRILLLIFVTIAPWFVFAQESETSDLYRTILSKDSLLFNVGFNTCNISVFENLLSTSFEFYHDIDGISDKDRFLSGLKKGLCANPTNYQARRELIPGSTKIFSLKDKNNNNSIYAAIQEGEHQFFEKQQGNPEQFGSSAKFTHLWLLENGVWKLTKSYSYEHVKKDANPHPEPAFDQDSSIEKWLQSIKVPALGLGIIENGRLKQIRAFGENKLGESAPYNTIFNVASLTKPVTAAVTLKLVSEGKLDLDEPVYKFWTDPDIASDSQSKKITVRHLLSHQSGFPNWRWMNNGKKLRFLFEPGTAYEYSGEGYEYLRKFLEKKFKKSLQQLAQELVFNPLKMTDTRYIWDTKIDLSRFAVGYSQDKNPYEIEKITEANAADNLLTTIEDYSKFVLGVFEGKLLSEASYQEMIKPQVTSVKGKHFGLGLELYTLQNNTKVLCHGGSDEGCRTIFFYIPATKKGIVIFTNSDNGALVYEPILKHYLGNIGQQIIDIETK